MSHREYKFIILIPMDKSHLQTNWTTYRLFLRINYLKHIHQYKESKIASTVLELILIKSLIGHLVNNQPKDDKLSQNKHYFKVIIQHLNNMKSKWFKKWPKLAMDLRKILIIYMKMSNQGSRMSIIV